MKKVNGILSNTIISNMVETITKNYKCDKIIVFGSYAKNKQNDDSDIDILIISDSEKALPRYKRGLKLRLLLSHYQVSKDILFYTHSEIDEWKDVNNSFIYTIFEEGKVVYE